MVAAAVVVSCVVVGLVVAVAFRQLRLVVAVAFRRLALRMGMVAFVAVPLLLFALDASSQAQLLAQSCS
jgi:hypothetical protein